MLLNSNGSAQDREHSEISRQEYTVQYGELVGLRRIGLRKLASDDGLRFIDVSFQGLSKHGIAGTGCPSFDC